MFAAESDEVATHTLAAAAREVLQDVARHREVPFLSLRDRLVRHLQAAGVPDAVKRIHRSQNFFKHADRDPEGTLAFDPERDPSGCYSMPFCCTDRWQGQKVPVEHQLHWAWILLTHPEATRLPESVNLDLAAVRLAVRGKSRSQVFELLAEHMGKWISEEAT